MRIKLFKNYFLQIFVIIDKEFSSFDFMFSIYKNIPSAGEVWSKRAEQKEFDNNSGAKS